MAKNFADQKEMEEQLKKEAPFSKQNEHDGHRYGDDISKQSDDALQEKYRDGTSIQGDIELQQEQESTAINHDDELQQKYGHRSEASPSMKDDRAGQKGDMNRDKEQHDEEHESHDNQRQMR